MSKKQPEVNENGERIYKYQDLANRLNPQGSLDNKTLIKCG